MKLHNNLVQGSEDWFKVRLGKLTASDAGVIATNGKGLETLCFEKAAELLTGKPKEAYTNEAMENGKLLEAEARNSLEIEKGIVAKQVGFVELNEYVGASPDGLLGEDGLLEIKCPTSRVFTEYLYSEKVDPKYYAQMQMQMYVIDRKWCDYAVYNPHFSNPLIVKRVERDEEYIAKLEAGINLGVKRIQDILEKIQSE